MYFRRLFPPWYPNSRRASQRPSVRFLMEPSPCPRLLIVRPSQEGRTMSRRGQGEGSIKKRTDGRWEARLELGYQGGKRRRKYICGKTRQDVQRKLAQARRQLEDYGQIPGEQATVGGFLRDWLAHTKNTVRASTYRDYKAICRLHITPHLGKVRLARLTTQDVQTILARKTEEAL